MPESFKEVLDAAVDDLLAHGFDSQERVDRWLRRLREAANNSLVSAASLEQRLRDGLAQRYKKAVDEGGILRMNPGVGRYTLDKVKPSLRAELDRRIMASANLIRLNRQQAIDKTLQRFSGWSTSIPPGGVSGETKREIKKNVRKSMQSLPFEERRVLIDQGHKLVSALNEIVAADGGAIAGEWNSHWRQAGYDYREDHKERDELIYLVRDSWADKAGLVKRGPKHEGPRSASAGLYYDEVTAAAQAPFCRCFMRWIYNLRDLPEEMLTAKGRAALEAARTRTDSAARADAAPREPDVEGLDESYLAALKKARDLDRMLFFDGVRRVRVVPDADQWNAHYDERRDEIVLQEKFLLKTFDDKVRTLLHEIGHRGQFRQRRLFARFRRSALARTQSFVAMANPVHSEDFRERGEVESGIADEIWAESYGRAMTGMAAPADLLEFWRRAVASRRRLVTKEEACYTPTWRLRPTRCQRCSMYLPIGPGSSGNACTKVAGAIEAHGHCDLFRPASAVDEKPKLGYEADRLRIERLRTLVDA